jgi:hypothetical protein
MKVSVAEHERPLRVLVEEARAVVEHHRDSGRLLNAGARAVVWVTVSRPEVRRGLAAGLRAVRDLRPAGAVIESTSAGIQLRRIDESWFVAGTAPWKPWAWRHLVRADHVVTADGGGGWSEGEPPCLDPAGDDACLVTVGRAERHTTGCHDGGMQRGIQITPPSVCRREEPAGGARR